MNSNNDVDLFDIPYDEEEEWYHQNIKTPADKAGAKGDPQSRNDKKRIMSNVLKKRRRSNDQKEDA